MIDIALLRDQPDLVRAGVKAKGYSLEPVEQAINADLARRDLLTRIEDFRARRNQLTAGDQETGRMIKQELKQLEPQLENITTELNRLLTQIPNLPSADVPVGQSELDNLEIRRWGTPRHFDFPVLDHLQLGQKLGILDFDAGSKVSGSQFFYWLGAGAMLEVALVQYALRKLQAAGFIPVITPDLAKSRFYLGTGYAPKGDEAQTYTIEDEDLGLIATAEVTLAGKHADEILNTNQLPLRYAGYSHCFRREAGAYGKYSKGLYRVHQFTKVEMFIYCLPEDSEKYHQEILTLEESIYRDLGLPYRVLQMCTGDLGAMAAKKYDLEAWMPGRQDYGEVTSTSNCTDYQARNLNIRCKSGSQPTRFVHMLNGTALVSSRVPLAILENYQQADGSVEVPHVLRPILGFESIR